MEAIREEQFFMNGNSLAEFRKKLIRTVLKLHPEGLTAKEIADFTGGEKRTANSILYGNLDTFVKDDDSLKWRLVCEEETDPVMRKLQNRERARYCSQADFDSLASWEYGHAYNGDIKYRTKNGKTIECDSKSELRLLEYLEENHLVKDVGGQNLHITYDTAFRQNVGYNPDIVALTRDDHIAVFEVKPVSAMDYHRNIEKYRSLAKYCEKNGFMYAMIDPDSDFTTYEEVVDMAVCPELMVVFSSLSEKARKAKDSEKPYAFFDESDVADWYAKYGAGYTKAQFRLQVHSLVLYFDWYNFSTHGFRVYTGPVKLDKEGEVIEVLGEG
ncbi:MAG: hypothetical protein MJ074_07305 [Oscillospiraceae bacterium]|nr:hypothetical protein [Oscillospiraceae bacterium]